MQSFGGGDAQMVGLAEEHCYDDSGAIRSYALLNEVVACDTDVDDRVSVMKMLACGWS